MRKRLLTLLCALLLLLGSAGFSGATQYWLPGVDQDSGWVDADKTRSGDTLLCWAASASNLLAWTGWWGGGMSSADDILGFYRDNWTDQVGNPRYAVEWWFTGTNLTQGLSGWSQVVSGSTHSGFYTQPLFDANWYRYEGWSSTSLIGYIQAGRGISIRIGTTINNVNYGHFLTAWGWDAVNNWLYITDSDFDSNQLRYYVISDTGGLSYDNHTWNITHIYGLNRNPDLTQPVPEPSTMLLLALGLLAVAWRVRAGRRNP